MGKAEEGWEGIPARIRQKPNIGVLLELGGRQEKRKQTSCNRKLEREQFGQPECSNC